MSGPKAALVALDECPICGGVVGVDTCEDCLWRPGSLTKYLGPCQNPETHASHPMDGGDWTCPGVEPK